MRKKIGSLYRSCCSTHQRKVTLFSFLAAEKCFKAHLKADNANANYKVHLPSFSLHSHEIQICLLSRRSWVGGGWTFKLSNRASEMSGWSKGRGGDPPHIKLSTDTDQRHFRDSTSLCFKVPRGYLATEAFGNETSCRCPKWERNQALPQMKLSLGEWPWGSKQLFTSQRNPPGHG